jgi:hypothetical protein
LAFVPEDKPYRDAYLRKAAALLPPPQGPDEGTDWTLVADTFYTRNLWYAKRGGQMWLPVLKTFNVMDPEATAP